MPVTIRRPINSLRAVEAAAALGVTTVERSDSGTRHIASYLLFLFSLRWIFSRIFLKCKGRRGGEEAEHLPLFLFSPPGNAPGSASAGPASPGQPGPVRGPVGRPHQIPGAMRAKRKECCSPESHGVILVGSRLVPKSSSVLMLVCPKFKAPCSGREGGGRSLRRRLRWV